MIAQTLRDVSGPNGCRQLRMECVSACESVFSSKVNLVDWAERWRKQLRNPIGNLVNDAHLAALAIEQGYAIYSADNDFRRFAGLTVVNPLAT